MLKINIKYKTVNKSHFPCCCLQSSTVLHMSERVSEWGFNCFFYDDYENDGCITDSRTLVTTTFPIFDHEGVQSSRELNSVYSVQYNPDSLNLELIQSLIEMPHLNACRRNVARLAERFVPFRRFPLITLRPLVQPV